MATARAVEINAHAAPGEIPLDTLEWLLKPACPTVRHLTSTGLLRRSERHREVREARAAIMHTGLWQLVVHTSGLSSQRRQSCAAH